MFYPVFRLQNNTLRWIFAKFDKDRKISRRLPRRFSRGARKSVSYLAPHPSLRATFPHRGRRSSLREQPALVSRVRVRTLQFAYLCAIWHTALFYGVCQQPDFRQKRKFTLTFRSGGIYRAQHIVSQDISNRHSRYITRSPQTAQFSWRPLRR